MDDQKILPSKETIRRFLERGTALYEPSSRNRNIPARCSSKSECGSRHSNRNPHGRDISEYQVTESAPTEEDLQSAFTHLSALAAQRPDTLATLRNYIRKWALWLKLGLSTLIEFATCVQTHLPGIFSCWLASRSAEREGWMLKSDFFPSDSRR